MVRQNIINQIEKLKRQNAAGTSHAKWCVLEKKATVDSLRDKKQELSKSKIAHRTGIQQASVSRRRSKRPLRK